MGIACLPFAGGRSRRRYQLIWRPAGRPGGTVGRPCHNARETVPQPSVDRATPSGDRATSAGSTTLAGSIISAGSVTSAGGATSVLEVILEAMFYHLNLAILVLVISQMPIYLLVPTLQRGNYRPIGTAGCIGHTMGSQLERGSP
jgi:hypothetical protein